MYLYAGGDVVIEDKNIVGIFDLDNSSWSVHTRKFLSVSEKKKKIISATEDIPKSFVLCKNENVILTQPNTSVLVKRL